MEKPRILVVDDEEAIRNTLHEWFDGCGFDVDRAKDGQEAVEKCERKRYDVITMDLNMPRMNGAEAMSRIKQRYPDVPIILFTGTPMDWEEVPLNSAAKVLVKPLKLRTIEEEVRRFLPNGRKSK
ncbi:MAG TPA: response regulator [Candidatus Hydrogenedentes bacterium]|nr:response regulator [Candidatus Hydrogenedentota bacterium]HPG67862.1 response regulator [Candidatus Hydrogenedentota bacterium]